MQSITRLSLAALFFLFVGPMRARALVDPQIEWKMLETEHFTIIYDSKQQWLANAYVQYAEEAWSADSQAFGEWPDKTVLVLNDQTDHANGEAVGVPYPLIQAFPVLPTDLDSIGDYHAWGGELVMHEYAHILTFEPAHGLIGGLRYVLGSVARPNMLLPRWYLEGLAVHLETRFSSGGRLRSPNFLAIPRAAVRGGVLRRDDIARANETTIPEWPGGARPYLLGALMWNEMAREKGDAIVGDLNRDNSRRFPYLIDGPPVSRLGTDYAGILNRAYDRVDARAHGQLAAIAKAGETKSQDLPQKSFFSHSPAISPDGDKLAFIAATPVRDSVFEIFQRPRGSSEPFLAQKPLLLDDPRSAAQRVSWLPDSSGFIYDSVERKDAYREYGDLFRLDLASKKAKRLTHGLRGREPAVSPDGKWIAFAQVGSGISRLALLPIDTVEGSGYRAIYAPPFGIRVSRPEFLSSDEVAFTEKGADGIEALRAVRLTPQVLSIAPQTLAEAERAQAAGSQSVRPPLRNLLPGFRPAHYPRQTADGLAFVSERTGAANVYLADANLASAAAITNVATRAMTPEIDARTHDLYFSLLAANGPQLARVAAADWREKPSSPPDIEPLVDLGSPPYAPLKLDAKPLSEGDYEPWRWMYPRYWIPAAYYLPGFFYAQAETGAQDPLGHHSYALLTAYDSITDRAAWGATYANAATRVPFTIAGTDYYEYIYEGGFTRHQTSAQALALANLPSSGSWRGAAGWTYLQTEIGPGVVVRDGPTIGVSYEKVSKRGFEISPEHGGSFSLFATRFLPTRDDHEYESADFKSSLYFSKWLRERHALALFLNGTIAPRMGSAFLGRTTIGGNYQTLAAQGALMMRGYPSGEFFGRNVFNGTLEYRFPLTDDYRGFGTIPLFIQRLHGAFFVDAITLDGAYFDFPNLAFQGSKIGTFYVGYGAELRADVTTFYYLPLTLILGGYFASEQRATPWSFVPFVGLGL